MGRKALQGGMGLAFFILAALTAEAQSEIDIHGPNRVYVSDSSSLYEAVVTSPNSFWFHLRVKLNGTQKTYSRTLVITSGPTYNFSKVVTGMETWGMQVGDELDYWGIAQGATGTVHNHHYLTVESDPITIETRTRNHILDQEALADRFRGVMA